MRKTKIHSLLFLFAICITAFTACMAEGNAEIPYSYGKKYVIENTLYSEKNSIDKISSGALTYAESAPGGVVSNVDELITAFGISSYGEPNAQLLAGSTTEIRLQNSVILEGTIVIKEGSYTLVGGGCTIARAENCGNAFLIQGGAITFERPADENTEFPEDAAPSLTIDGRKMSDKPFISVKNDATFTVNAKVLVKDIVTSDNGGFISAEDKATVSVYACRFENCKAKNGGAIYISSDKTESEYSGGLTVKNCKFTGCTAENGGAIFSVGKLSILGCDFVKNEASQNGGAIAVNGGSAELTDVLADESKAVNGGALHNAGVVTIVNFYMNKNQAVSGGAIYNDNSCLLSGASIRENIASSNGGGIYNDGALYLNSGSMVSNESAELGGGVYSTKGSVFKMEGGEILYCNAKYASAVYSEGSFVMTTGTIGKNKGNAPQVAVLGTMEMGAKAVCYHGDVIGLVDGENGFPKIKLTGNIGSNEKQYVAFYQKNGDGFSVRNSSGLTVFEGSDEAIAAALEKFSVHGGKLFPYKISDSGKMVRAFPTAFVIIVSSVLLIGAGGAFAVIKLKKRPVKDKAEN